jgi:hypothetical protein
MASGRVSTSSCHNYYMNVTEIGYNLVVDLNTSSSALFLLVKASPILRHSVSDLLPVAVFLFRLLYMIAAGIRNHTTKT